MIITCSSPIPITGDCDPSRRCTTSELKLQTSAIYDSYIIIITTVLAMYPDLERNAYLLSNLGSSVFMIGCER